MSQSHTSYPQLETYFKPWQKTKNGKTTYIYSSDFAIDLLRKPVTPEDFYNLALAIEGKNLYYGEKASIKDINMKFLKKTFKNSGKVEVPQIENLQKHVDDDFDSLTQDLISKDPIYTQNITILDKTNVKLLQESIKTSALNKEIKQDKNAFEKDFDKKIQDAFERALLNYKKNPNKEALDKFNNICLAIYDMIVEHKKWLKETGNSWMRVQLFESKIEIKRLQKAFRDELFLHAALEGHIKAQEQLIFITHPLDYVSATTNQLECVHINYPSSIKNSYQFTKLLIELNSKIADRKAEIKEFNKNKIAHIRAHKPIPSSSQPLYGNLFYITDLVTAELASKLLEIRVNKLINLEAMQKQITETQLPSNNPILEEVKSSQSNNIKPYRESQPMPMPQNNKNINVVVSSEQEKKFHHSAPDISSPIVQAIIHNSPTQHSKPIKCPSKNHFTPKELPNSPENINLPKIHIEVDSVTNPHLFLVREEENTGNLGPAYAVQLVNKKKQEQKNICNSPMTFDESIAASMDDSAGSASASPVTSIRIPGTLSFLSDIGGGKRLQEESPLNTNSFASAISLAKKRSLS